MIWVAAACAGSLWSQVQSSVAAIAVLRVHLGLKGLTPGGPLHTSKPLYERQTQGKLHGEEAIKTEQLIGIGSKIQR